MKARILGAVVGISAMLGGALVAGPARASGSYTGRAYVAGDGTMYTDWYDEGVVSVAVHRSSNATCLWQAILWANGFLAKSEIDGIFGDRTDAATRAFQRSRGLSADGSAGRQSWTAAGGVSHTVTASGWANGVYSGREHGFNVRRSDAGNYQFNLGSGWLWASYNSRTCS
ncbi:peptidoglycan-binding protein [Kribbella shirazensis]|uniref:Peptidoglycan hydrolase-like protein with peptidoglycan-binding domain n=1 Tax=Kribbella shirazensis TaxID=1105143 RepID=A0A7X6A0B5_9ACTN|nr:peptidoglycan hydrolase-like protein with peptidoglycan-binding domain [Kribbella shirazensis]